jgi:hypothetical protein
VGEALGQWKLEEYTGILQWQNGIYWLRNSDGSWTEPKSRGIPKGAIPFATAIKAYKAMDFSRRPVVLPEFTIVRTRFIGYGLALRGQLQKWRKWITEPVRVYMGGKPTGKASHVFWFCASCRAAERGIKLPPEDIRGMHTITGTAPDQWQSSPHRLPWLEDQPDLHPGFIDNANLIVKDEDME